MLLQIHRARVLLLAIVLLLIFGGLTFYLQPEDPENPKGVAVRGGQFLLFALTSSAIKKRNAFSFSVVDYTQNKWALAREVPDTRHYLCKKRVYEESLPTVSIVICFRNESSLLLGRTVHTVLRRTPEDLLDSIVLVDDNGDLDSLDPYSLNNKDMALVHTFLPPPRAPPLVCAHGPSFVPLAPG